jgi:FkbM family methyltransferase
MTLVRNLIRKFGFDIVRYPYRYKRTKVSIINDWRKNRFKLIQHYKINVVLDVGANDGHFGLELRDSGYQGQIISFEPLKDEFFKLKERASHDPSWQVFNFALGDINTKAEINVAGNSQSSSLLEMGIVHKTSAPESLYVGKQTIDVRKLDDLFHEYTSKNVYLKLDVQGYEEKVFLGFKDNLDKVKAVQLEMSLVELYEGEKTFFEHSNFLLQKGFKLVSLEPGFYDPTSGRLLQVDGIWCR